MGLWAKLFGSKKKKTPQKAQHKTSSLTPHQLPKPESSWEAATVKWFSPQKGYGFLTREEGKKPDIFIHKSLLKIYHLDTLGEGQKVEVRWGKGKVKDGLEAGELRLLK